MRLHRLEFRGLGPFRDTQVVDFADLSASGLFLLEGPTGAGKSTIIDAIVFALYGSVAGASSDKGRLVSHFLAGGAAPFAELVFQTAAGVHRIRRTPTYEAAKARGTGTTTRNATVTLTRLGSPEDAGGHPISTSMREAGDEIVRIVGLTKEQFVGTIVLPQGEFATFLRAEGKERLPILQRIFRTEPYERLQRRLWEAKGEAERERSAASQVLEVALGGFHVAAGTTAEHEAWVGVDPADSGAVAGAVASALAALAAASADAGRAASEAAAALVTASSVHDAVLARTRRRDRLRQAIARGAALAERAEEHAASAARLASAERAARVADALAHEAGAAADRAGAVSADAEARAALLASQQDLPVAGLRAALDEARALTGHLRPLAELEAGLPERAVVVTERHAQRDRAQAEAQAQEAALAQLPARRAGLVERRDVAAASAALVPSLRQELVRSRARRAAAEELLRAEACLVRAHEVLAARVAALAEAEATARTLADRYRDGLAAELAGLLRVDQPCPVCGSCDHPAPMQPDGDLVTRDRVEAAELAVRAARRAADADREAVAAAERHLAQQEASAAGCDRHQAESACVEAEAALAAAEAAADQLHGLDAALAALEAERQTCTEHRTTALTTVAALDAEIAALEQGIAADRERVAAALAGHPSVADRLSVELASTTALERAERAARDRQAAEAAWIAADAGLATALAREGFADASAARTAALPLAERAALAEQVRAHEDEAAQVAGILAEPELAGVDPQEAIDPEPTAAAVAQARGVHEEAVAARGRATARLADAGAQAAAVRAAAEERDACLARTQPLLAVARLAWGQNVLAMDLATYVLQRRFETVVAAANEHLRVMSDGALALATTDEAEGRTRKAGLGLRVVDLRTGQERSPRTLSGGETFYTALSLALGLAAVVTGEAGGVDLGTLFVDEGFGSLDGDTLDDVLAVLTSLRAGGRVIGVVSHVEEMKQRIPERIEVRRDEVAGHSAVRVVA